MAIASEAAKDRWRTDLRIDRKPDGYVVTYRIEGVASEEEARRHALHLSTVMNDWFERDGDHP